MARLVCLALAAATLGACVSNSGNDGGIVILDNVAPDQMCLLSAMENAPFLSHGFVDVVFEGTYVFNALVKSRITAMAGQEDQRTILLQGANIDIGFPNSTLFSASELQMLKDQNLTHFRSLFSAPLAPNGGTTTASFVLIPAGLSAAVKAKFAGMALPADGVEAVANFTIDGDLAGGTVTSQQFQYPVTMTQLVFNVGSCPLPMGSVPRTGGCFLGQDAAVDCCMETSGTLTCPARVSTM